MQEKELRQTLDNLKKIELSKKNVVDKIKFWKELITDLYNIKAVVYTDMPHGTDVGNPTLEKVQVIDRLENNIKELQEDLRELEECVNWFNKLISALDPIAQRIMVLRYLQNCTWIKIEQDTRMSERYCRKIHNKALKTLLNNK